MQDGAVAVAVAVGGEVEGAVGRGGEPGERPRDSGQSVGGQTWFRTRGWAGGGNVGLDPGLAGGEVDRPEPVPAGFGDEQAIAADDQALRGLEPLGEGGRGAVVDAVHRAAPLV